MLPKSLYELLPYLYLIAGLIALFQLSHPAATLSGILLLAAGSMVSYWRYSYRFARQTG